MMAWAYKDAGKRGACRLWRAVNTCERCGTEFISRYPSSTKYCAACGETVRAQQNRDRVRRYREKHKADGAVVQDQEDTTKV